MKNKFKMTVTQNQVKKLILESVFNPSVSPDDYDGYFIIDEFGDPEFIIETKD